MDEPHNSTDEPRLPNRDAASGEAVHSQGGHSQGGESQGRLPQGNGASTPTHAQPPQVEVPTVEAAIEVYAQSRAPGEMPPDEVPEPTDDSDDDASLSANGRGVAGGQGVDGTGAPEHPEPTGQREWYILKVQSNREDSIREALLRRIAVAGLDGFFGEIIVPIEMVSEFKGGKKKVVKRKLYPGYLVVNMEITEDSWFLVRETPGIGDFTGSGGKPSPMLAHEVSRIVTKQEDKTDDAPKLKIKFKAGDRVKITEGTFENFEGDVDTIDETNGRVTVMINIFGRSTPGDLEYWHIEGIFRDWCAVGIGVCLHRGELHGREAQRRVGLRDVGRAAGRARDLVTGHAI
jgi:transcriptional antiterminator NusG